MMKRRKQEGVALVVTLILLAIITIVVVAFLAVTQRNRALTTTATDQASAKFMADAGRERAMSEIAARLLTRSNLAPVQMLVSTNFTTKTGFDPGLTGFRPDNVSYTTSALDNTNQPAPGAGPIYDPSYGVPLTYPQLMTMLTNLYIDPRPPVFVRTNASPIYPAEFRFYLDLNRDGRFEPTGMQWDMAYTNGSAFPVAVGRKYFVGDPEWIGVLEHPDRPHAADNRFVGRYAYVVVPEGLTLDLNAMHNYAKAYAPGGDLNISMARDHFLRNQGVGTYELNLAAFLVGLNTNVWPAPNQWGNANDYFYSWDTPGTFNTGLAFEDAVGLLQFRYRRDQFDPTVFGPNYLLPPPNGSYQSIMSSESTNGAAAAVFAQTDRIDEYANGPLPLTTDYGRGVENLPTTEAALDDPTDAPWSGSPNPTRFVSMDDLFDAKKVPQNFISRLETISQNNGATNTTYNVDTFYRLLSQLGTDSGTEPASFQPGLGVDSYTALTPGVAYHPSDFINLNFDNRDLSKSGGKAYKAPDLEPWQPLAFFTNAAARMLRSQAFIGSDGRLINFTNILVWPTNNYDGAVHRILQVAANIYDSVDTNGMESLTGANEPKLPTVFRPYFRAEVINDGISPVHTNVYIAGYTVQDTVPIVDATNFVHYSETNPSTSRYWNLDDPGVVDFILQNPPTTLAAAASQKMVLGVPLVVGAKKGYPNFNELAAETAIQIQRNLQLFRPTIHALPTQTNEFYFLGITNQLGVEAWNSYKTIYPRQLTMAVEVDFDMALVGTNATGNYANVVQQWPPYITAGGWSVSTNFAGSMSIAANSWQGQKFQIPLMTNHIFLTNSLWLPKEYPRFRPAVSNVLNVVSSTPNEYLIPDWNLTITNRVRYVVLDTATGRIVDYANLDRMTWSTNVVDAMELQDRAGRDSQGSQFWDMRRVHGNQAVITDPTTGANNQMLISLGYSTVSDSIWRNYGAQQLSTRDRDLAIDAFRRFATGQPGINFPGRANPIDPTGLKAQAPFSPARRLELKRSYEVNDPLVHYTSYDLAPPPGEQDPLPQPAGWASIPVEHLKTIGKVNKRYKPWGKGDDALATDPVYIDPLITSSDDWNFPTNKLPNVGWIGRIHRGTPWQTIYLKSTDRVVYTNGVRGPITVGLTVTNWYDPQRNTRGILNEFGLPNYATPDKDRPFLDLFTTAPNSTSTRGQVSVNQSGEAAWSAVLGGVMALTNDVTLASAQNLNASGSRPWVIQPGSPQLRHIVEGINATRSAAPFYGQFRTRGDVLAVPELTLSSPYLDQTIDPIRRGISDEALERIPQQVMSLLRLGDPRVVVYAYGQSLKPAPLSINLDPAYLNVVTNYQITGEYATRSVIQFERVPPLANDPTNQTRLKAVVVESKVLSPE